VYLAQLYIENLRNIARQELDLTRGFNLFVGSNGAGKSSVLEAAYLLSHAQSFRSGKAEHLILRGEQYMALGATVQQRSASRRIALLRQHGNWLARLDQSAVAKVSTILRQLALVCFEPGSHQLISGPSQERRRFLDWGVFHVEQDYLAAASCYRRALQQRNAALKHAAGDPELVVWEEEMIRAAEIVTRQREAYFAVFSAHAARIAHQFMPELGEPTLVWERGWATGQSLEQLLAHHRTRDRELGHTTRGPHRAGWSIGFARVPHREQLSRGQEKLCALACILAQAQVHAELRGEWPVVALDDLASELDQEHQKSVIDWLQARAEQVLISGLDVPESLRANRHPSRVFHVEHGTIRDLL
jgi:DNA replication and repair protein RecF